MALVEPVGLSELAEYELVVTLALEYLLSDISDVVSERCTSLPIRLDYRLCIKGERVITAKAREVEILFGEAPAFNRSGVCALLSSGKFVKKCAPLLFADLGAGSAELLSVLDALAELGGEGLFTIKEVSVGYDVLSRFVVIRG
jgi:hypothetical protein